MPQISQCVLTDCEALASLVNCAYRGAEGHAGWTSEIAMVEGQRVTTAGLEADLASSSSASIWLLREQGALQGCVRIEATRSPSGEPACVISMLAVLPQCQDRGWGRVLLDHAENEGRLQGAAVARMTVVSVRDSLIAWYERRGYRRTGETESFPYEERRFGTPLRSDLEFAVLEKPL